MLSRIAESLYWIGRYIERADATARIVDVHLSTTLGDPTSEERGVLSNLMSAMGAPSGLDEPTMADVVDSLAFDPAQPWSVTAALQHARENARGAREIVPAELWESLNVTYHGLGERRSAASVLGPGVFFTFVRERAAMAMGLANSTMVRDDGWRFFTLGAALERVDMTARMLSTPALADGRAPVLAGLLRSVGGHDAFIRTYAGSVTAENVAEFLLRDRHFPRSVAFALMVADERLAELDPGAEDRLGVTDEARRSVGRVRAALEYRNSQELLGDLRRLVDALQKLTSRTSDEITQRYFGKSLLVRWTEEVPM